MDITKLVDIARRAGADAVHPGYGFLSERPEFARAVIEAGLTWIGPEPQVIEALGDKLRAREIALGVGAPLVTGSDGPVASAAEALAFARQFGLPIAIKAAFGGGGRGLKIAHRLEEVEELFHSATREAAAAFGRSECYIEQFLDRPRHIETQVLADKHGGVVVVGTRDCSMQRRNQKLIEEAPAPFLSDAQRERIEQASRDICRAAGYSGAGTVEFLLSSDGKISFLEVNTRLQVEHPVTEETTGVDLVREQFRIADGLPLELTGTPKANGHALEFRINAEDPGRGFLPMGGEIALFAPPSGPGIRLDSGVETGSTVPPVFDSLIAKLIVWGRTRDEAIARARRALSEFRVEGVPTALPFHRAALDHPDFSGKFAVHTRWIETDFAEVLNAAPRAVSPLDSTTLRGRIEIDGKLIQVGIPDAFLRLIGRGNIGDAASTQDAVSSDVSAVRAPVPGLIALWCVADGDIVAEGDVVAVMDAMKMETNVVAPRAGRISLIAAVGSLQAASAIIARIALVDAGVAKTNPLEVKD